MRREERAGGKEAGGFGAEEESVEGRSWMMNRRLGKAVARAMLAWPEDPPTWEERTMG